MNLSPVNTRFTRKVFQLLLIGVCSIMIIPKGLCQGISVSPSRIFFQVAPDGTAQKEIRVDNPGSQDIVFTTSIRDWNRDSMGVKVYKDPGTLDLSNAKWLTVSPAQLKIAAGQSATLTVTLKAPPGAKPVTNSMLFLSQINEQNPERENGKNGKAVAISFRLEVGIHIYNTLPEIQPHKNLYFTSMRNIGRNSDSTSLLTIKVKNGGNVVTDGLLKVDITNISTGAEYKLTDRAISMFPGTGQVIHFNLPLRLPKGKYQMVAILDAGTDSDLKVAKMELNYD